MRRGRASARVVVGVALTTLVGAPASALPTMIRLGYTDCASCHIASQGGGPLNAYGRGIDVAQSLRGEAPGEQEYGAGSLAEFDVLGNQRTIAGVTIPLRTQAV